MKQTWKHLPICLGIPLAVGGLSAWLTRDSMEIFGMLEQPPLSPPSWLFPIVWTVLYLLMGLASCRVYTADVPERRSGRALAVYGLQLAVNFLWPIFFFRAGWYLFSFFWLLLLWCLIGILIFLFGRIAPSTRWMLLPYLLWVTFAGYLDLGIWLLN